MRQLNGGGFNTRPEFRILRLKKTPLKDTDGKEKFKRMLSFLLVDKGRLILTTLSFKEFEIQPRSEILKNFQVHVALYIQENYGNL